MITAPDIYFTPEYGRLNERHEGGVFEAFSFKNGRGEVYHQFIRRPLGHFEGFENYSDIITPYGYGGPVILDAGEDRQALAAEFGKTFKEYCLDTHTVTAFIRFHPICQNALDFNDVFNEVTPIRKTIAIDLTRDLFYGEFDRTVRNSCRHAESRRLTYQHDTALETMDTFVTMYYALMDKKNTSEYYYFPKEYFDSMKELGDMVELVNARLDGEIIAASLNLKYKDFLHGHLSTTTPDSYRTGAIEFIKATRAMSASKEGYRWLHLGGGFTNDPEDSLFKFKRKFTKTPPFDFYIGKSIYDAKAYDALCALAARHKSADDDSYFPKYRA